MDASVIYAIDPAKVVQVMLVPNDNPYLLTLPTLPAATQNPVPTATP